VEPGRKGRKKKKRGQQRKVQLKGTKGRKQPKKMTGARKITTSNRFGVFLPI